MTIPALLFGLLLASLYGTLFHLWRGGSGGRILLYVLLSWVGFWLGHFIGDLLDWGFGSLGALHLGTATLGSALLLLVGYWLSLVDTGGAE